jgi:hypothetical protein
MRLLSILIALFSAALCSAASGAPQVTLESPLDLSTQDQEWCLSSPEDSMVLTVSDEGKPPIVLRVCASYGGGKAEIVTDKKGRNYVLFKYGVGRGTGNAMDTYLRVYRLDGNNLFRIMEIPLTWKTNQVDQFAYDYEVGTSAVLGLEIRLRERQQIYGADVMSPSAEGECCIPTERTRTIWIDPEQ